MVLGCGACLARGSARAPALYRALNPIIEEILRSASHSGDLMVLTVNPYALDGRPEAYAGVQV